MPGIEVKYADRFLNGLSGALSFPAVYCATDHTPKTITTAPHYFTRSRTDHIQNLMRAGGEVQSPLPLAFFMEYVSCICFRSMLEHTRLISTLAPKELEQGNDERGGVDLIISTHDKHTRKAISLLSMNVKLRKTKPEQRSEPHCFDHKLQCPSIELPVGNWLVTTKEGEVVTAKDWIRTIAVPSLILSGKIPHIEKLRRYLAITTERTLNYYLFKLGDYMRGSYTPSPQESRLFPAEETEFDMLKKKLMFIHSVFVEVATAV